MLNETMSPQSKDLLRLQSQAEQLLAEYRVVQDRYQLNGESFRRYFAHFQKCGRHLESAVKKLGKASRHSCIEDMDDDWSDY